MELNKEEIDLLSFLVRMELRDKNYTYRMKGKLTKLVKKLTIPVVVGMLCEHNCITTSV